MRSLTKPLTLSIDGAETRFRLSLMDAFSGACLLKLITAKCLPHFASLDFSDPETLGPEVIRILPSFLSSLSETELRDLMQKCLNHVEQELPAGFQPVMVRSSFGIRELEHDTVACPAGDPGFVPARCVNVDEVLFLPVAAGLWQQHELWDGTYTLNDLLDILEVLQVRQENERLCMESMRQA